MRSVWFEKLGDAPWQKTDEREKAETMFRHVALSYFNSRPSSSTTDKPPPSDKPNVSANGFLSQLCSINVTSIPEVPQETEATLEEEIYRYLKFEGGVGDVNQPLVWWKVCSFFPLNVSLADFIYSSNMLAPSQPSPAWPGTFSPSLLPVCQSSGLSQNLGTFARIFEAP